MTKTSITRCALRLVATPALALALGMPATAAAQESAAAMVNQDEAYAELVDVFQQPELADAIFEGSIKDLRKVWKADPFMAEMEAECPGILDAMIEGSTPLMRKIDQRANREYRNALLGILKANLTPEEAMAATVWFRSEDGQAMLASAARNVTTEASLGEIVATEEGSASREAFARDKEASVQRVMGEMDAPMQRRVAMAFMDSSWGPKLVALRPQMDEARYTIFNAPLSAEEEAEMEAVMTQTIDDHYATCS
ncbi:hypothetical protein [Paraurantiacibacter namhicola]|uniref:DUF2059 domain-containing protein n=1 Tax=Paraurantiacibacter namhicola TaxID=645517 RepID=A0A1C7D7G1_9SPHN|nr:hypothetical protein [Paraurantiacibacter namhicola]ANU07243.1 hypothetical protein A6F65_00933 [Paraurantiacibacter namhicola]